MRGEAEMIEGCFSVPGFRGKVKRSTEVTIKAQDIHGKPIRYRADGCLRMPCSTNTTIWTACSISTA